MKLVLDEAGTQDARDIYTSSTWVQSSTLLVPEAHATIARAVRDGRFAPSGRSRAAAILRELLAQVEPIELDITLSERAGELALAHELRGSDAVHLASFERTSSPRSVLVAADGELARAADALGYAVAVPGGG